MNEVYIIAAKRTPIDGILGNLAELSARQLGGDASAVAIEYINL